LSEVVVRDQQLEVGDGGAGRTGGQQRGRPLLAGVGAQGVVAGRHRRDEGLVGEVGEHLAAPERQRRVERLDRLVVAAGDEVAAGTSGQGDEPAGVEVLRLDEQRVPRFAPHQQPRRVARAAVRLEDATQPGHQGLQAPGGGRRRVVAPQVVEQPIDRHRAVDVEEQPREQQPYLPPAEVELDAIVLDPERTEDAEAHALSTRSRAPPHGGAPPGEVTHGRPGG
jgi:hypothetical protein